MEKTFEERLAEAKAAVSAVSPQEANECKYLDPDILFIDPRNEEDYDSWTYGMEVLPQDHTWQHASIDVSVSPSDANMAE